MAHENHLFTILTETQAGAKWSIDVMALFEEVEINQIKLYGKFYEEEAAIKKFREFTSPWLKGSFVPMAEEDVDWKMLYKRVREWYKKIHT